MFVIVFAALFLQLRLHIVFVFFGFLEYPIVSIEDPFDKEDWEHVKHFSSLGICQVCSVFLSGELWLESFGISFPHF
jgi:hypothetical protein